MNNKVSPKGLYAPFSKGTYTWIFQVCKICAFSPKNPSKRQKFYISRRSRYVYTSFLGKMFLFQPENFCHQLFGDFAIHFERWPNISQNRCFPGWNGALHPLSVWVSNAASCVFSWTKRTQMKFWVVSLVIGSTINGASTRSMEA